MVLIKFQGNPANRFGFASPASRATRPAVQVRDSEIKGNRERTGNSLSNTDNRHNCIISITCKKQNFKADQQLTNLNIRDVCVCVRRTRSLDQHHSVIDVFSPGACKEESKHYHSASQQTIL